MNPAPAAFLDLTTLRKMKRIFVAMIGGTVLALGISLVVLPGPAFLVIPAGLAILAVEFAWARRWLRSARAILPLSSKSASRTSKKPTVRSVWRSTVFLFRQVRRTVVPRRKLT